jgi:hypothetical protein
MSFWGLSPIPITVVLTKEPSPPPTLQLLEHTRSARLYRKKIAFNIGYKT